MPGKPALFHSARDRGCGGVSCQIMTLGWVYGVGHGGEGQAKPLGLGGCSALARRLSRGSSVFWQVGSSATLGTNSTFVGSILALTSATVGTKTTVAGRVLARNGQVSLNANTITRATAGAQRRRRPPRRRRPLRPDPVAVSLPVFRRVRAANPAPPVRPPPRLKSWQVPLVSPCSSSAGTERADDAAGGTEHCVIRRFRLLSDEASEPTAGLPRRRAPRTGAGSRQRI